MAGTALNSASKMPTTDMTASRAWGNTVPLTAAASGAEAVRVAACTRSRRELKAQGAG